MSVYQKRIIGYENTDVLPEGASVASLFRLVNVGYRQSIDGYYDNTGNIVSGTCNTYGGCNYYEYIQYYDNNGNESIVDADSTYYYLVTRDTNIVVLRYNISASINNNKPFTLTSVNNGIDYRNNYNTRINKEHS